MHDEGGPSPCPLHMDVVPNLMIDTTRYYKEGMSDTNPPFIDCNNFMPNGLHNNGILTMTKQIPNMGRLKLVVTSEVVSSLETSGTLLNDGSSYEVGLSKPMSTCILAMSFPLTLHEEWPPRLYPIYLVDGLS